MVKMCKASTVVEMAYLMPVVLLTWILVIFSLFHFHDKSVIAGAAYESAIVGAELWNDVEEEKITKIEKYFQERVKDKLLFYKNVDSEVKVEETKVEITATTARYFMKVNVKEWAVISMPEQEIRKKQCWEEAVEDAIK